MSPGRHAAHSDDGDYLDFHLAASTSNQKINLADIEAKWKDVPDKYFIIIAHFLAGHINDTDAMDRFNGPILKASIKSFYWLFLVQYAALAVLGVIMNAAIMVYVLYHRLYKDVTHAFIINLAFCHTVQCALVLPVSLMVMLIQNWIFGQFLCFFLPMLQDIPLHVAMISHILIAWDRMRWLNDPLKGRLPAFVCCCATWLTGMVIALPYPIYTIYVELGDYVSRLDGIGLCVVNLMDDMHEYTRGLFLIMYCAPAILLAYLYIRTSQELRPPEGPFAVMMYEHRADYRVRPRNSSASSVDHTANNNNAGLTTITSHNNNGSQATSGGGSSSAGRSSGAATTLTRSYDLYSAEMDMYREKRKQRNFGSMAATQVVCICPLMVLRFARLSLEETYENQKHFDFTYLMFVWIAFLPTVIFPCIYAAQILPRNEQERLRGYFRLSTKKSRRANTTNACGNASGDYHKGTGDNCEEAAIKDDQTSTKTNTNTNVSNDDEYTLSGKSDTSKSLRTKWDRGGNKIDRHANPKDRFALDPYRHGKGKYRGGGLLTGRGAADAGVVNNLGKNMRNKKHDVKINIISDGQNPGGGGGGGGGDCGGSGNRQSSSHMSMSSTSSRHHHHQQQQKQQQQQQQHHQLGKSRQRKLHVDTNNDSNLLDDSSTSNYGDGEESSVVSSMITPNRSHLAARWHNATMSLSNDDIGLGLQQKDMSFSECSSTFSHMDSCSSTLEHDLEIIDLLERERSMDIHDMIEREKHGEKVRLTGERRLLPDIEKLYAQRSPKLKHEAYSYDKSSSSSMSAGMTSGLLPSTGSDPLSLPQQTETYSLASTLNDVGVLPPTEEEEVPQDFYDSYTPGATTNIPPPAQSNLSSICATGAAGQQQQQQQQQQQPPVVAAAAAPPPYQYQYSRRQSRNSSHHSGSGCGSGGGGHGSSSHRVSKRDSFNSLNGTDLIAGTFGELDPTQPLTKMSVVDSRGVRRSSPRNSSFSTSSARSSLKSRDYGHGSAHSAHPELDFRENIFAEL